MLRMKIFYCRLNDCSETSALEDKLESTSAIIESKYSPWQLLDIGITGQQRAELSFSGKLSWVK